MISREHLIKYLFILFSLSSIPIYAQLWVMGTAPLTPGNYWKYTTTSWGTKESDSYLVLDTKEIIKGQEYFVVKGNTKDDGWFYKAYMGIRDSFYIRYFEEDDDSVYHYFKFNSQPGDIWSEWSSNFEIIFTVLDTFMINVWGRREIAREIYIDAGLIQLYQLWTDSLGLLSEIGVGEYRTDLVGCVINGIVYGDTSMIITSIDETNPEIKEFVLYQNFPNPFNSSSTISYYLPNNTDVKLTIYNILSEKISTLVNEYQYAGLHRIVFDAAYLASGMYIYRLETTQAFDSKPMIILK